jgi:hypothetical protein
MDVARFRPLTTLPGLLAIGSVAVAILLALALWSSHAPRASAGPPEFALYYPGAVILTDREQHDVRGVDGYPCNHPALKVLKTKDSAQDVYGWYHDRLSAIGWAYGGQNDSLASISAVSAARSQQWYSRREDSFQVQIDDGQRLAQEGINISVDSQWTVFEISYWLSRKPCAGGLAG